MATDPAPLVARAQRGDRDAFAELYRTRVRDVGRYVAAIVQGVERAEDVVADTFLAAWERIGSLRDPNRFDAWLFRIAHHRAIDEVRRRQAIPLDESWQVADPSRLSSPPGLVELQEDVTAVRRALQLLSPDQRDVLVFRLLRDLPHAEVARQMGKSEEAVRALQYRALGRLRDLMRRDPGHDS